MLRLPGLPSKDIPQEREPRTPPHDDGVGSGGRSVARRTKLASSWDDAPAWRLPSAWWLIPFGQAPPPPSPTASMPRNGISRIQRRQRFLPCFPSVGLPFGIRFHCVAPLLSV